MAIILKRTSDVRNVAVKMLGYGESGAGKTRLISTMPNPVAFSAEAGLLSLKKMDIPYIQIESIDDLQEAYQWAIGSDEAKQFESIALDSISEIAEVVLSTEKKRTNNGKLVDPRQAYGAMQEQMADLIRAFRDIPGKHVYMSAKVEKTQDEMGRILYAPSMPGNKAGQALPYFFDLVLALRKERDAEGNVVRGIMTDSDGIWQAKDRSGVLDTWEAPDLGAIIKKVVGE